MNLKIDRLKLEFEKHPLLVPFRIGNKPPMTELESLVVKVNGQGVGRATLANT